MRPDLAGGATTALLGGLKLAVGELHAAVLLRPIFFLAPQLRCRCEAANGVAVKPQSRAAGKSATYLQGTVVGA